MKWNELDEMSCSVSRTLAVIGDRWSLLILRDCFQRVRRFEEFQSRLGITRHLLADRLKKLVRCGVLRRVPYQNRPKRHEYVLTEKGLDLYPILLAIVRWGDIHTTGDRGRPVLLQHKTCGQFFDPIMICSECRTEVKAREVQPHVGPGGANESLSEASLVRLGPLARKAS